MSDKEKKTRALIILSQMAGCLQLARLVPDKTASDELLEMGKQAALTLADEAFFPSRTVKRGRPKSAAASKR